MDRLILATALAAVAVGVAFLLQRRRAEPPPTATGYNIPDHIDRADFDGPDVPWLVVVFTSGTCNTCAGVWEKAELLGGGGQVVAQEVEVSAHPDLHERYGINAVPATLVVDDRGEVRASFLGSVTATDLWAVVAELREPGTLPEDGCDPSSPSRT